ncbi:multidrug ABC transporter ATP-binding protein [Clostridia bacterium]|nr:multidrug ABC transporter ATP-binding protein [Clostridia bacterium]
MTLNHQEGEEIKKYLKGNYVFLIFGPLAKLFETVFELITPKITADIIDNDIKNLDKNSLYEHIFYIAVLTVLGLIAALICQYFSAKAAYGFSSKLRADLFKKVMHFSFEDIDKFGASTLTTRLTLDTISVMAGLNYVLRLISRTPFLIIGSIIACFLIDAKLALFFISCTFLLCIAVYFITKWAIGVYQKIQTKLDNLTTLVRENIDGARVVRTFAKQDYEKEKFNSKATNYSETVIKTIKYDTLITPLAFFILNLGTILVLYIGSYDVNIGDLTQGELAAMINYLALILLVILQIVNIMPFLTLALASRKRVLELLTVTDLEDENGISKIENCNKIIEFINVQKCFGENSEPVFKDINLTIEKGDCIGITGGIGSGKSTLVKLLLREYDFDGEILFYGKDINCYSKKFLREYIGLVSQKAIILGGTIADNIRIANPIITDEQMQKVLEIAQFSDCDINLEVSQNSLSGGQKQRVSIARILARDPEILILDDSSSALDYSTEKKLIETLKTMDKTIILITQRENTLTFCNKILRM